MTDLSYIHSSSRLPPFRLINAVAVFARIATRYGICSERLLAGSGISLADLDDPQKLIATTQEMAIARNAIRLIPVPWIGLELGKEYHFSANGKLGMAMMCCETMMEALKLALTYIHLTASYHQYFLKIKGNTGVAKFKEIIDLGDIRQYICESEVASLYSMAHLFYEDASVFKELHFAYEKPSYADRYADTFGCPIKFDAPVHLIVFDVDHLSKPLKLANPLVKNSLIKECDQLVSRLKEHETITARISQELSLHQDKFPTLDQLARRINMSPRTIRRRLMDESTSYKNILTDMRKTKAIELLLTTGLPMEKVALHLGFSEVSSFYRAFKNWTGTTPKSYRENIL
ncbi:MAG: AraC family transcriptional regulator [Proteobacteria bacterium]|nr:AraC family transcriptional regulator [Pseudomonadota bacterium]